MEFSNEHNELRRTMSRFVESEINPHVEKWEAAGQFPIREVFKKMGGLGLLGISKPESAGGLGLDYSYEMVAAEELGLVTSGGIAMAVGAQTNMATPALARFGSTELQEQFLTPAINGDFIGAIAVSEPQAGSDVAQLKTSAKKQGDDYVINGSKMWITNGISCDFYCLLANTSEGPAHKNKSLIVVPKNTPGIEVSKPIKKIGNLLSDTAQVYFDNVKVPQRYLIGEENKGFSMQMLQFQEERLWCAANPLKGMERVISETINYCKDRHAFGQPLIYNQAIHFKLAELQTEIEALRSLIYRATSQYIKGQDVTKLASMAKLKVGRLSRELHDACLQYWGGMGYTQENIAARGWLDGRLISIAGGADEIMLNIICKFMDTLPAQ
ncbi:MAG: acyl-CoA dehydrogenase family protein [Bermanella sp.]